MRVAHKLQDIIACENSNEAGCRRQVVLCKNLFILLIEKHVGGSTTLQIGFDSRRAIVCRMHNRSHTAQAGGHFDSGTGRGLCETNKDGPVFLADARFYEGVIRKIRRKLMEN